MSIEKILKGDKPNETIAKLKSKRYTEQPDIASAKKALDIKEHDINSPIIRKDKRVVVDKEEDSESAQKVIDTGGESGNFRTEKVARIGLAIQKLIIKRIVAFLFGNPVEYNSSERNENEKTISKALKRILYDVKSNSINRKVARAIFSYKEAAELWYAVPKPNSNYGFKSEFKLKCAIFSPANGDTLYPYYDETGDMVAFSREFERVESEKTTTTYFETYTDKEHWLWIKSSNEYLLADGFPKKISIGKIPIVYGYQDHFETEDVDSLIDRLELLLSNFADTNDYHASPKIFTTGQINGWSKKGESGAVIEGEEGSTMQYVSWQNAPESVKLEIETLLRMIYTIAQTPDISFDSVKGLGAISGIALKLLFMDAHLKVQDKREIFDEYLQRRVNIITSYIGQFNTSLEKDCQEIEIEPEITPYMLVDEQAEIEKWTTANGNKPLLSHKQSVKIANLSQDPDSDYEQILKEESADNIFKITEPTEA